MEKDTSRLNRIRGIANYQFEGDIGRRLFPDEVKVSLSRRTGRVRHVYLDGALMATLRPTDGFFSLTVDGARRLSSLVRPPRFRVAVQGDVEELIRRGGNVFARHVVTADLDIRVGEEVIVTDDKDGVLAVGRALLTGREMLSFKRGVAVKVRSGVGGSRNDAKG